MFKGHYVNSINEKGRLSVPSKFREELGEGGHDHVVVTKSLDACLTAYTPDDWAELEQKAARLSTVKRAEMFFRRHVIGSAEECQIDAQGRILIPASLREYAGFKKKCLCLGIGNRFEIWDEDVYGAYKDDMALNETLLGSLEDLGL